MRLTKLFTLLLLLCSFSIGWAETSPGKHYALRLKPGQDLKVELNRFIKEKQLRACAVVTCVGSLTRASLRFANEPGASLVDGPLEIITLSGCGGEGYWHLLGFFQPVEEIRVVVLRQPHSFCDVEGLQH